jgi:hypothetical protein
MSPLQDIPRFELRNWGDAYLRDGHFDEDRMLALIQEVLEGGAQQGFALTRLVAHMEWALEDFPGVDDLVEYETRLNYILPRIKTQSYERTTSPSLAGTSLSTLYARTQ